MTCKAHRIFGPVPSRRLGLSLGIDLVPLKTCTLNCLYCQLGRPSRPTVERSEYTPVSDVLGELRMELPKISSCDWITISGSGEPTLHSGIGRVIRGIKEMTDVPVAVLTNGTLLHDPAVRRDLAAADLVAPSLDAGSEDVFRTLNRPHAGLTLGKLAGGIRDFASIFSGKLWMEVMLVKGINDGEEELRAIAALAAQIEPDRVQLNTVARPPSEPDALPLSPPEMAAAKSVIAEAVGGIPVDLIAGFESRRIGKHRGDIESAIENFVDRRPGTLDDLAAALGATRPEIAGRLDRLIAAGRVTERRFGEKKYYIAAGRRRGR